MSGIHTAVVRFQDVPRGLAALESTDVEPHTAFTVVRVTSGTAEAGDELVGNLALTGDVDLFNRTRHDHVHAVVLLAQTTRDAAVAFMKD